MRFSRGYRAPAADPEPPLGVILHYRGRAIPCDVLRDPDLDRRGETVWVAVPSEPVTFQPGETPELTATVLPDGCLLHGPRDREPDDAEWWLPDVF